MTSRVQDQDQQKNAFSSSNQKDKEKHSTTRKIIFHSVTLLFFWRLYAKTAHKNVTRGGGLQTASENRFLSAAELKSTVHLLESAAAKNPPIPRASPTLSLLSPPIYPPFSLLSLPLHPAASDDEARGARIGRRAEHWRLGWRAEHRRLAGRRGAASPATVTRRRGDSWGGVARRIQRRRLALRGGRSDSHRWMAARRRGAVAGLYGSDPPPRRPWASLSPAMEDGHAGDFDFFFQNLDSNFLLF